MKTLSVGVLFLGLFVSGCDKAQEDWVKTTVDLTRVKGLEDCTAFELSGPFYSKVIRCPNSDTSITYKNGKQTRHTTVIDQVPIDIEPPTPDLEVTDKLREKGKTIGDCIEIRPGFLLCKK